MVVPVVASVSTKSRLATPPAGSVGPEPVMRVVTCVVVVSSGVPTVSVGAVPNVPAGFCASVVAEIRFDASPLPALGVHPEAASDDELHPARATSRPAATMSATDLRTDPHFTKVFG